VCKIRIQKMCYRQNSALWHSFLSPTGPESKRISCNNVLSCADTPALVRQYEAKIFVAVVKYEDELS
jgi:hypothetical protein